MLKSAIPYACFTDTKSLRVQKLRAWKKHKKVCFTDTKSLRVQKHLDVFLVWMKSFTDTKSLRVQKPVVKNAIFDIRFY